MHCPSHDAPCLVSASGWRAYRCEAFRTGGARKQGAARAPHEPGIHTGHSMHRNSNGTVAASQAHTGSQATSALPERACTPEARAHRRVGHGRGRGEERRILRPRARRRGAAQRQHGRQDVPRAVRERAVLRNLEPVELDDGQVLPARTAASGAPRRDLPTSGARGAAALRRAGRGVRAVCARRGAGRRGQ